MDALAPSPNRLTPTPLEQYRREQLALRLAAAEAAAGRLDGRLEVALRARDCGDVFADRTALGAAAQKEWWSRMLSRCDSQLDEDISSMEPGDRLSAVQRAWASTTRDLPGHLALANSAVADPLLQVQGRRYARLLALFAGRADPADDRAATAAGLQLVDELSSAPARRTGMPATL